MRDVIYKMLTDTVESAVDMCISDEQPSSEWNFTELNEILLPNVPINPVSLSDEQKEKGIKKAELVQKLKEEAVKLYEAKEAEFPEAEHIRELERVVLLKTIDRKWMSHIDDMDQLRQGIGLQAYGQKDPLVEYRISGFDMFDEMTAAIREETVKMLLHVRVEQKVEREEVAKVTGTNKDDTLAKAPKKRAEQKIYPNDPCPCGSGKKYKQCCGRLK
jgi:preprotein translocase subunit SecA